MTALASRRRDSLTPALLAAAALHLAVFAIATILARPSIGPMGTAVPITIVSSAPTTDSRAAEAAPQTQTAQTETPTPQTKAPAPPPAPARPTPPQPVPDKTAPKALHPPKPTRDAFNLDRLAADVARSTRAAPARPGFAPPGPERQETAPERRLDAGQGVSQSDVAGLTQLLERLWNPSCEAVGGEGLVIPVRFTVGFDGRLIGAVNAGGREASPNPVLAAATRRALDAIHQAEPYGAVYRGETFTVNFDARTACANR